jgi:hypothetical protein
MKIAYFGQKKGSPEKPEITGFLGFFLLLIITLSIGGGLLLRKTA